MPTRTESDSVPRFTLPTTYRPWFAFFLLLAAVTFMSWVSWLKWGDLLVDYGQQAYVPWQLSEGQVLYKDIYYIYGPLSAYAHALMFKIFGPGLLVLALFNIGLVGILGAVIYSLFKVISNEWTALLAGLTFFMVFAFGQYQGGGTFNFICPYSYELTHGIFLGFVLLRQFAGYLSRPTHPQLAGLGLTTGLIFLTKPEVFLACFLAISISLACAFRFWNDGQTIQRIGIWTAAFLAPSLGFIAFFSFHMPAGDAVQTIIKPWTYLSNQELRALPLYHWVMGTDHLETNIVTMLLYAVSVTAVFAVLLAFNRYARQRIPSTPVFMTLGIGLILLFAILFSHQINWREVAKPLPILMGVLLVATGLRLKADYDKEALPALSINLLAISLFSFLLLIKVFFNAHFYHYGFALTLPATLMAVYVILNGFPAGANRRGLWLTLPYRSMATVLLLVFIVAQTRFEMTMYRLKSFPVGTGRDVILDYHSFMEPRGTVVNAALEYIDQVMEPGEAFATFPDAIMINYLARRRSSTGVITLNPGVWILSGDSVIQDELRKNPPRYILLVDRKFPEMGKNYFGQDFARPLFNWIMENYEPDRRFGETPGSGQGFGIQFFKKKD